MKYIKSFKLLLESIEIYDYSLTDDNNKIVKYNFLDQDNNEYLVEFKRKSSSEYELTYYVYDIDIKDWSVSKIVNVNSWRLTKTIFGSILNDFIKRKNVDKVSLIGLSKDQEQNYISKRTNMYVRFLERNPINGYSVESFGNKINIIKKK